MGQARRIARKQAKLKNNKLHRAEHKFNLATIINNDDPFGTYRYTLMETLILDMNKHWKSNIIDSDIPAVFRRTIKRNIDSAQYKELKDFIEYAMMDITDTDLYKLQVIICKKYNIKLSTNTKSSNNKTYQSHFKSPHSVNGHWRNQPYGPRNNPKYKKIWIEEFDKGVA